jgi:glycosyltransferase involved in cell wall biosynthesis
MTTAVDPSISCVVPARDCDAFLGEAIDSVLAQDYGADRIEVVVIDDASADATPELLDAYGDRIVRIRHETPQGVHAAVEAGLAICTGQLITRLDADDAYTPDRFRVMTRALAEHPDATLVYSDMTVVDERGDTLEPSYNAAAGIAPLSGRVFGRLLSGNFISAGAMMLRAELLEQILPFPPHVAVHDWWLALQAARVGPVVAVPDALYRYRRHDRNLNLGRTGSARLPLLQRELPLRRWLMRTVDVEEVEAGALQAALHAYDAQLAHVAELADRPARDIVPEAPGDHDAWLAAMNDASDALDRGDLVVAMGRLIRAAGEDPHDRESRALVAQLAPHLHALPAAA